MEIYSLLKKRNFKFNVRLALVAVVFSILTYFIVLSNLNNYTLTAEPQLPFENYSHNIYKDIDHNGTSERYYLGKAHTSDTYFCQPFNENGTLRDQYNFSSPILTNSVPSFDFNSDGSDELFIFTKNDSLIFLSIIDIKNSTFLAKEIPILNKPNVVTTDFWDVYEILSKFASLNNDGKYKLYISPLTGHSIYPRGLFAIDLNTITVIDSFVTTAPVSKILFHDINNDKFDDIVIRASSSGNTDDLTGIHDNTNWLLFLNKDLNLIQNPFSIGEFLTGIYFDICKSNGNEFILLIFSNRKNEVPKDFIAKMDYNFNFLDKMELEDSKNVEAYIKEDDLFASSFYMLFKSGEIIRYDYEFNSINSFTLNPDIYAFVAVEDILEEFGKEVIIRTKDKLIILSADLKMLTYFSFDSPIQSISFVDINPSTKLISVDTQNNSQLLTPSINYFSRFWYVVLLLISILYFILIYLLHRFFSRIGRVIGAYNYFNDDLQIGIIITDNKGRIKSYNKSIMHILPPDTSIQKNKNIFSVFGSINEFINVIIETYRDEKETKKDLSLSRGDFKFIGNVHALPLFTSLGVPHSYIIKIKNITNDIENDRSITWSRIAQKVAHDIKTPLSTIQLNLAALSTRINKNETLNLDEVNDDINMISNEITMIKELTRSFLKFSNLEKPKLQCVNPNEIIETAAKNFAHFFNGNIKFEYKIDQAINSIWIDPNQFVQLFHIFIENSIDAFTDSGFIQISMDLVEDLQHNGGTYVEILISDNGKGISEEDISKIFEPYYTNKNDGTGMGLSIAKKIVEDHSGTIEIKSKINFGTNVIIKLPHVLEND